MQKKKKKCVAQHVQCCCFAFSSLFVVLVSVDVVDVVTS